MKIMRPSASSLIERTNLSQWEFEFGDFGGKRIGSTPIIVQVLIECRREFAVAIMD